MERVVEITLNAQRDGGVREAATPRTGAIWRRWLSWLRGLSARRVRHLRLREMLPLGDRRFLAVVEFERQRFLIAGTAGSLKLLTRLPGASPDPAGTAYEEPHC